MLWARELIVVCAAVLGELERTPRVAWGGPRRSTRWTTLSSPQQHLSPHSLFHSISVQISQSVRRPFETSLVVASPTLSSTRHLPSSDPYSSYA